MVRNRNDDFENILQSWVLGPFCYIVVCSSQVLDVKLKQPTASGAGLTSAAKQRLESRTSLAGLLWLASQGLLFSGLLLRNLN